MPEVKLANRGSVLIDEEDLFHMEHRWILHKDGMARRQVTTNGDKRTYWLHREIVGATRGVEVRFLNHNKLDCRRHNLLKTEPKDRSRRPRTTGGRTEKFNMTELGVARVNSFRRMNGMRVVKPKIRSCLKCETEFDSSGIQNRLCPSCSWIATSHTDWGSKSYV